MRQYLVFAAGIIAVCGTVPYIIDTLRGKTRPNIVTWLTWTIINSINAFAAFSDGAIQTAIFSTFATAATSAIVVLGFKYGVKHYTRFDVTCQVVALLGIPLWLLTNQPALAVIIVLAVDLAGGLPTLRHAWQKPYEETVQTFILSSIAGVLTLASIAEYSFIALAMPLYIFLFDVSLIATITHRRRQAEPIAQTA